MKNEVKDMWAVRSLVTGPDGQTSDIITKVKTRRHARHVKSFMKETYKGVCEVKLSIHKMIEATNDVNQANIVDHKVYY